MGQKSNQNKNKNKKIGHLPHIIYIMNSKWINNQNVRAKAMFFRRKQEKSS